VALSYDDSTINIVVSIIIIIILNPAIASVSLITYVASGGGGGCKLPPAVFQVSGSVLDRDEIPTTFVRKFFRCTHAIRV